MFFRSAMLLAASTARLACSCGRRPGTQGRHFKNCATIAARRGDTLSQHLAKPPAANNSLKSAPITVTVAEVKKTLSGNPKTKA